MRARSLFEPLPALTILLLNTTRVTRAKAVKHAPKAPWMIEDELVERYNAAYRELVTTGPPVTILPF